MNDGGGNPVVRRNLRYVRQDKDGTPSYVVKDPVTLRYFRFGAMEVWLMQRMDGTRSLAQLAEELRTAHGRTASVAALATLVRRLRELGVAQRDPRERSAILMEVIRRQRRVRLSGNRNTILRMRLSFGDPDALLGRMVAAMPFFWTRGFVIASAALFTLYALLLALYWTPFTAGMAELYRPTNLNASFLLTIYLLGTGIFLIHEFGHGLTCKRFGGEVHEMGAMLFYFSPAFFCNVNDAWTFEKRSHRLWVTFAGGWIQLWVAGLAALVWLAAEPGTLLQRTAFLATVIGGGYSILINFNPLIPLDGYYALTDWLELPNLRQRSFAYLGATLKRRVLRMAVPLPSVTPREHRIFLRYAAASITYTVLLLSLFGLWFGGLLVSHFGGWGWFFVALLAWRVTARPRHAAMRLARLLRSDRPPITRSSRARLGGAAALIMLLAALALPWTVRTSATAVVEPVERVWLRAPEAARLAALHVTEGDRVAPGDTLLVLMDRELDMTLRAARAELSALDREVAAAHSRSDAAALRLATVARATAAARVRALELRADALVLRAPFPATVATARLEEQIGARFLPGDTIMELWHADRLRARLLIPQREAGGVRAGTPLRIRFAALPGVTWRARVQGLQPAAQNGLLEAVVPLGTALSLPAQLRPGMTGRARLAVDRTTAGSALLRELRRLVRLDLLL